MVHGAKQCNGESYSLKTCKKYTSNLKTIIKQKFPFGAFINDPIWLTEDTWLKAINNGIKTEIGRRRNASGDLIEERSDGIGRVVLSNICDYQMSLETPEGLKNCAILNTNYSMCLRSGENGDIVYDNMRWDYERESLTVMVAEKKHPNSTRCLFTLILIRRHASSPVWQLILLLGMIMLIYNLRKRIKSVQCFHPYQV
jgi:hypothetical protein